MVHSLLQYILLFIIYKIFLVRHVIFFVGHVIFFIIYFLKSQLLKGENKMDFNKKFFLSVHDAEHQEIFIFNKGKPMSYKQIKNELINEMERLKKDEGLALFVGEFYLMFRCDSALREVYQCVLYKWLFAMYCFDTTKLKNAFAFLLDCLFIYGEWTHTRRVPKSMIKDLAEQTQKLKDDSVGAKLSGGMNITIDTVINGKPLSYWDEKQKEYDKQRYHN